MERYIGEIASTACALVWAVAVILFRMSGERVPPTALNLFKNTVATPLVLITMVAMNVPLWPAYDAWTWGILLVSGVLGVSIADAVFFAGLNRLGAGWTGVISCTYSPFMILITAFFFGVRLTPAVAVGAALVGAAVVLASGRVQTEVGGMRSLVTGMALGALSQLIMAVAVAILKYPVFGHQAVFDHAGVLGVTFWRLVAGTGALALWLVTSPKRATAFRWFWPSSIWRSMLPGAILGGYVAMVIWILGIKEIQGSVARAAVLNETTALYLPLLGALFLREPLTRRKLVAVTLAFGGAWIVAIQP